MATDMLNHEERLHKDHSQRLGNEQNKIANLNS